MTPNEAHLLAFIDAEIITKGYPPSFREMEAAISLGGPSGVHRILGRLERDGYIARGRYRNRAIRVLKLADGSLPLSMRQDAATLHREAREVIERYIDTLGMPLRRDAVADDILAELGSAGITLARHRYAPARAA